MFQSSYSFNDEGVLNFPSIDLFNIIIDINEYPNFLPGCNAVYIKKKTDNVIIADLLASFNGLKGQYTSRITFLQPYELKAGWIYIEAIEGIFKSLHCRWVFIPITLKQTNVKFHIDCEFKSRLLNSAFRIIHKSIQRKIINSFKERAEYLRKLKTSNFSD